MSHYFLNCSENFLGDKKVSEVLYILLQKIGIENKNGTYLITETQTKKLYELGLISRPMILNKIDYLISAGFLDKSGCNYILDTKKGIKNSSYRIYLSKDEVELLLSTKIKNIIKIYAYLLFLNANKDPKKSEIEFNLNHLRSVIGLSKTGTTYKSIKYILSVLESLGLIEYKVKDNNYTLSVISTNSHSDSAIYGFKNIQNKTILIPTTNKYTKLSPICQKLFVWIQENSIDKSITKFIEKSKLTTKETKISEEELSFAIKELIDHNFLFEEEEYYSIYYGNLIDSFFVAKITEKEIKKLKNMNESIVIALYAYLKIKFNKEKIENGFVYISLPDLCTKFGLNKSNQNKKRIVNLMSALKNKNLIDYKLLTQKIEGGKIISRYRLYYVGLKEE